MSDDRMHEINDYINEAKNVFDVKGEPGHKVAQNPHDKKWYVMGVVGKYLMPVSDGYSSKAEAMKRAKGMGAIEKKGLGWK